MTLSINGEAFDINESSITLETLLNRLEIAKKRGIAIAINDKVIPKSQWGECFVCDNDRIEIISPFQGG